MTGLFTPLSHHLRHLIPIDGPGAKGFLGRNEIAVKHTCRLAPAKVQGARARLVARYGQRPVKGPELLVILPNHARLAVNLANYDVIGFQTKPSFDNLMSYLREELNIEHRQGRFEAFGREVFAGVFPISIDAEEFMRFAKAPPSPVARRLKNSLDGRKLMLSVDRLDYSKGIPQRIEAIGRFLELYPDYRRRFSALQIAPTTRETIPEYGEINREVAEAAGRVNGMFGDLDWAPVRYVNRSVSRATLAQLYRSARVGAVTPLRDGMNLVAKEYVMAQDLEDPGVLVLSRFAGAAHELRGALFVNPYDTDGMAHAFRAAFEMSREERIARMEPMMVQVQEHDVHRWSREFLDALTDKAVVDQPLRIVERAVG